MAKWNIYENDLDGMTTYFLGMAFNKRRGDKIKKVWQKIPIDTDILITHGPPFGILDKSVGCEDLLTKVIKVKPKLHVFGHIHQGYGVYAENDNKFVNAALANSIDYLETENHKIVNVPVVVYL